MLDETSKVPLGQLLTQVSDRWQGALSAALADQGLAIVAGACGDLLLLMPAEGIAQTALAERAGLSKQAVQQMLDRLESEGAIRREADPHDRRAKRVVATEHGLAARAARRRVEIALEAGLREELGKKLFGKLRKSLRRLGSKPPASLPKA